jgi:PAS domain S-box-containing protein
MDRPWDRWLLAGAAAAIALLVVNVGLTFRNTRQLEDDFLWVAHTHRAISGLEELLSLAKDAETGQRGYLVTGEPRYLEPYLSAVAAIDTKVAEVERLTAENPGQRARFPELRNLIAARLRELEHVITLRRDGLDAARARVMEGGGKAQMDALRALVAEMIDDEHGVLDQRVATSDRAYRVAVAAGLATGVSALAAIGAFLLLLQRHLAARDAAERAVAEHAERLRTTLASIGDGVITTDVEGRITNLNAVAESLTGYAHAEAVGRPLGEIFRIVNERTREPVASPVERALREGVIVGLANHTVLIARDGSERPIDDSAAPIRCKEGELVGCVLVFRDVVERRRDELALAESEERLRIAQRVARIGTFDWDIQRDHGRWTPELEAMYGLPEGGYAGTRAAWEALLHPEDRERMAERAAAALEDGDFADEWRVVWPDGTTRWLAGRARVFKDRDGRPLRMLGMNIDITDRKETEQELRRLAAELSDANRLKDEFLATLAHELRNPLAPLASGLEVLRMSEGGAELARIRPMMERQLGLLVRLVDDLLDVGRIRGGTVELQKKPVEIREVVEYAVETTRPLIDASGHQLDVRVPSEPLLVDADPARLSQVFANLLNNAARYTPRGGRIALRVERRGDDVVVSVRDSGSGIPPDMLAAVFDLFMQVDRSLERSQGGLGIGLTVAKRLVDLHGGTIEARSEGPGRGSEFVVRVPLARSEAAGAAARAAPKEAAGVGRSHILVADDNEDALHGLALVLEGRGHRVSKAQSGLEAVAEAERLRPDVVVLDIGMPGLNGYEACSRIREQPWGRDMLLVALTGWGQESDQRRSREAGFDHHIIKPADAESIERLLALGRAG